MEHIPIDNRTENAVLGGIITYPKYYDKVVPYISSEDVFMQTRAKRLWKKISKMIRDNKTIDMMTVCQSISEGDRGQGLTQSYVVDCTSDVPLKDMIEVYARTLYEKYLLRVVVSTTDKIKDEAIKNGDDVY